MRNKSASVAATLAVLALSWHLPGCGGGGDGTGGEEQAAGEEPVTVAQDCSWVGTDELSVGEDVSQRLAAYAETPITADIEGLSVRDRQVLDKLVAAARIMNELFWEQACPCHEAIAERIQAYAGPQGEALRAYFALNVGPWDRRFDREPFCGGWPHPPGANFYPLNLSNEERERLSGGEGPLVALCTMVRRDAAGDLVAVPYSVFFHEQLTRAAKLLREAAVLSDNESLRHFLTARADAFLSDDYYASDMLWMDIDSPIEVTIGPYETYEDGLFGYKAAFEAFITVADPAESARLMRFKGELPWLEAHLPIPEVYKNPNRGAESPIRVADEYYSAGDTRAGIQTIAFNLPNDERVREAKGSKKVMLRNVMNAKFNKILVPIAQELLTKSQLKDLTAESFFLHTLFHEMSHGLGPGRIVVDGRATEVRLELKEHYSTLEEAKADVMGEWAIFMLQGKGLFPESILRQQAATYLAGLFRSVRFGIAEAHGQANAIQFNWLLEKGALAYDDKQARFHVDEVAFSDAIEDLVRTICMIQAEGNHNSAGKLIKHYASMPPVLAQALARLDHIPVDIRPVFAVD
jgi:hypothetical protein